MLKRNVKCFGIIVFLALFGICFIGCNISGYKVEYYKISWETYNSRDSYPTADESLNFVKNAAGTESLGNYWCGGKSSEGLRDFFNEKCGYVSNMDDILSSIEQDQTHGVWYSPGLLSTGPNYCQYFYITNENFR